MIKGTARTIATSFLLLALTIATLPPQVTAQGSGTVSPEESVMREAITTLGWPDTITLAPMAMTLGDDETVYMLWPPADAARYLTKTKVSATNGVTTEGDIQYARILALGEQGGQFVIDKLIENGFTASSYQGRPAAIARAGQEMCGTGGLVGLLNRYLAEFLQKAGAPEGTQYCPEAAGGLIAWSCGTHAFVARDDTGQGNEDAIAQALFAAAEHQGLCDLGDTLVILAQTGDVQGTHTLNDYRPIADAVNSYYGQNAYGEVALSYTYQDADGSAGSQDWYVVPGQMADYRRKETEFATAAVQAAFANGAPREELELARVIVVHAGPSQQASANSPQPGPLATACAWSESFQSHEITVGPPGNESTVYASSLIVVGETDGLGLWAHEVGHSLYGRRALYGQFTNVGDRYNYQQPWGLNGDVSAWGLMGYGNWWGTPPASDPVHMCAYSKESAGWLSFTPATLGERYTLTALESQSGSATALQVDDPTSADPEAYFLAEARQAGVSYGAPESGVVLYKVTWDATNEHGVVNNLNSQTGAMRASAHGMSYDRPTLRSAGASDGVTIYRSVPERLEFTLQSEDSATGYAAVVSADVFTPTNLVGAGVTPTPVRSAAPPAVTSNMPGPLPDIDLHAWDDQGRHVGVNYATGEYENQIPGAIASGDLRGDQEWIYVPEGTPVRYLVSAEKTRQFLEANPEYASEARPQEFEITFGRFDAQGNYTVADGGQGQAAAGVDAPLSAPTDPSLSYRPAPAAAYGRNRPADLRLTGYLGLILLGGVAGWVTALRRR